MKTSDLILLGAIVGGGALAVWKGPALLNSVLDKINPIAAVERGIGGYLTESKTAAGTIYGDVKNGLAQIYEDIKKASQPRISLPVFGPQIDWGAQIKQGLIATNPFFGPLLRLF